MRNARRWLITYALFNAVLYSLLLPLWEGFDEPFHFAYVQQLANGGGWPDPRTSLLSREVEVSLLLAPASEPVQRNLPQVTSYAQYFAWPATKRAEARRELLTIPPELRKEPSAVANYEAHQPPLAYLALALPERLLARAPLPIRVAILRILCAVAGSLLLLGGTDRLLGQLGVPDSFKNIALFCLLSCQMLWATIAHVGNDWLAVAVAVWTLAALNRYDGSPSLRNAAIAAALLAVGLLTKAYFLAFVPLLGVLCLLRRRWQQFGIASLIVCGLAGPWYVRNLVQYGVLTGTQESRAGIGLADVVHEAARMNWPGTIWWSVFSSMWTSNNVFGTFSANTLILTIGAVSIALMLWAASRHTGTEWITFAYCALFVLALGYATVVSRIFTHGEARGPSPWYAQLLAAPLLSLALLGASRWRMAGRVVSAVMLVLFGYILAVTYAVKLIPLYGGFQERTTLAAVGALYISRLRTLTENLDSVTLAPAAVIYVLAGVTIILVFAQLIGLLRAVFGRAH
jgi:hypothetical protein